VTDSGLPRSTGRHPARYLLYPLRPFGRAVLRRRFHVRITGAENVPRRGPVIMACNHVGVMDGPLLAVVGPRPVHALTKVEMFTGFMGWGLLRSGQIPLDRYHYDPHAIKECLRVLRAGNAIGIFPEGSRGAGEFDRFHLGAAYLGLVTGAPIVPVVQFGTRAPGAHTGSMPPKGEPVDMVIGAPMTFDAVPWPRTHQAVTDASVRLRQHLIAHLDHAKQVTGRQLPGPLPAGEAEPDPASAITDQEAS
jgi:1-acyl-sn-glycerol-3-phosphate acyltransferase